VRRGQHGTRLLPIDAVEAVSPHQRLLHVRRRRSAASRAVGGLSTLGPQSRRATEKTSRSMVAAWRFGAPRVAAAGRAGGGAARRQWPWVRRTLVVGAEAAVVIALMLQALVVWAALMAAHAVRRSFALARRGAHHGVERVKATRAQRRDELAPQEITFSSAPPPKSAHHHVGA